jgi:hypothetical protein
MNRYRLHKTRVSLPQEKKLNLEAELIVPDWGDKVNFGIGLSYLPVSYIDWRAVTYDDPLQELTISPSQGLLIWPLTSPTLIPT